MQNQSQQQFEQEVMRELWEEQHTNYDSTEAWDDTKEFAAWVDAMEADHILQHQHPDCQEGTCTVCGESFSAERKALGYSVCLWCGEEQAMQDRQYWTVVPLNKSNYTLITNKEELKGLNPKSNNTDLQKYLTELYNNGESEL